MSVRHVQAIFWKQCKDTIKNKTILIQFLMFPIMAIIMTFSVGNDFGLSSRYFIIMFTSMYTAMAPILILSTIMSEDKEKGCLRMMMMSCVKPIEYLIGMSSYVIILCLLGVGAMGVVANYNPQEFLQFIGFSTFSILISVVIGAIVGMLAKNQTAASGLSVPVMLLCSFTPMLSMFNENIKAIGQFLYSQQVNQLINAIPSQQDLLPSLLIIAGNFIVVLLIYILTFKKGKSFD